MQSYQVLLLGVSRLLIYRLLAKISASCQDIDDKSVVCFAGLTVCPVTCEATLLSSNSSRHHLSITFRNYSLLDKMRQKWVLALVLCSPTLFLWRYANKYVLLCCLRTVDNAIMIACAKVNFMLCFLLQFGTYGFQQQLSQVLEKQLPSNVYSVPEMSSLTMQSLVCVVTV